MNSTADISRNSASNNTAPGHHLANNHDEHNVYDVAVIGAGPAGENVAQYATQGSGLSAVLIEGGLVGGDCSYYACMPSKALLRPLEVAGASAHLTGLEAARVSAPGLLERRDKWVSHYDDAGQVFWAASTGIDVMRGWARLDGERRVVVSTPEGVRLLEARRAVVLANGSQPVIPAELQDVHPWGSRDATGVKEVPKRLIIVGGGVVACEAATWMSALGSKVTMLVRGPRLLARAEPFASKIVTESLAERGVRILTGARVTSCKRAGASDRGTGRIHGGAVRILCDQEAFDADEIMVATGRRPALDRVGLETVGLSPDDVVSGRLPEWLYAVGDASGQATLTHMGKYQARIIGERIGARAAGADPHRHPGSPGGLHRPAGGLQRAHSGAGARCGHEYRHRPCGLHLRGGRRPDARRRPRRGRPGRGPRQSNRRGSDLRGTGGRRAHPRRDHRHHRQGPDSAAAPCHTRLPHRQ